MSKEIAKKEDHAAPEAGPDPWFRFITGAMMLALVPWSFWMFHESSMWGYVVMYSILVPVCGELIRAAGLQLGDFLGQLLVTAGIVSASPEGRHPLEDPEVRGKWRRQFWQIVVHGSFTAVGYYFLFILPTQDASWPNMWENPLEVFRPLPAAGEPDVPEALKHFLIIQLWVWNYTAMYHLFVDPYNKDYSQTAIHHIATVILVGFGGATFYYKISLLVLFVNDGVDTSVDMLRIANFLKLRGARALFFVEGVLLFMTAHFFRWRIWLQPGLIIDTVKTSVIWQCNGTSKYLAETTGSEAVTYEDSWLEEARCGQELGLPLLRHAMTGAKLNPWELHTLILFTGHTLLILLQVLHVFWMLLIFRLIYRAATEGSDEGSKFYEGANEQGASSEDEAKREQAAVVAAQTGAVVAEKSVTALRQRKPAAAVVA